MPVEFIDILNLPELEIGHSKKVLFSSDRFHTWIHGDYPATQGPMHKHSADQQFYCVKGECTFHFPDGSSRKLTPGMLVTIPAGQLYQLDNTGDEYMILLGARAESAGKPRYSNDNQEVSENDHALRNLDKIKAPEEKKAGAQIKSWRRKRVGSLFTNREALPHHLYTPPNPWSWAPAPTSHGSLISVVGR